MKKGRLLAIAGILSLALTACGGKDGGPLTVLDTPKDYSVTTVVVGKDKAVSEYIVETLDKDYYNPTELKQSVEQAVTNFNSEKGSSDAACVKSFEADDAGKQVKVNIDYKTAADYAAMHVSDFFVGSVSEAKNAGYNIDDVQAIADGASASGLTDETVVICSEVLDVEVPGDVLLASPNVTKKDASTVSVGEADGYSVIIFK